jgi:DNA polymerase III subunit epsilon
MTAERMPGRSHRRRDQAQQHWRQAEFLVVDFETTGLALRRAAPLSVGWVPVVQGRARLAGAGYTLIRHEGPVPLETLRIHRLLPEDLAGAPALPDVADALWGVLRGRTLVAHGAAIERAMLRRCGVHLRFGEVLDTAILARALGRLDGTRDLFPQPLPQLASRLGLPAHRPHHAFGDALTSAGVFLALATRLEQHGRGNLGDLLRIGHLRPRLP